MRSGQQQKSLLEISVSVPVAILPFLTGKQFCFYFPVRKWDFKGASFADPFKPEVNFLLMF